MAPKGNKILGKCLFLKGKGTKKDFYEKKCDILLPKIGIYLLVEGHGVHIYKPRCAISPGEVIRPQLSDPAGSGTGPDGFIKSGYARSYISNRPPLFALHLAHRCSISSKSF